MNNLPKRKAFNFYSSYDEAFEVLSEKNQIKLFKAIRDVQFFRIHINDIEFTETDLKFAWLIIKHSVESQVLGYCRANKVDYNNTIKDTLGVSLEDTPLQEKEEEEVQEEDKEQNILNLPANELTDKDFTLSKLTSYDNLSATYKEKLEEFLNRYIEDLELKILNANGNKKTLQYEDFILSLEAKGYKYKNFISAYKTWNRGMK